MFSPFKTYFRNALNDHSTLEDGCERHDIYTLCQLRHKAYKPSWTYSDIVDGIKASGVWCPNRNYIVPEAIKPHDISNLDGYCGQVAGHTDYRRLVKMYKKSKHVLCSDGSVRKNGILDTPRGALLTSGEVLVTISHSCSLCM